MNVVLPLAGGPTTSQRRGGSGGASVETPQHNFMYYLEIMCAIAPRAEYMPPGELFRRLNEDPAALIEPELVRAGFLNNTRQIIDPELRALLETAKAHAAAGTCARVELMERFDVIRQTVRRVPVVSLSGIPRLAEWYLNYWISRACQAPAYDLEHGFGVRGFRERVFNTMLLEALAFFFRHRTLPLRGRRDPYADRIRAWMDENGRAYARGMTHARHHFFFVQWCLARGWMVVNTYSLKRR